MTKSEWLWLWLHTNNNNSERSVVIHLMVPQFRTKEEDEDLRRIVGGWMDGLLAGCNESDGHDRLW